MRNALLIIALLAILTGCGSLAMLVRNAADTAVSEALASGAADDQRTTAVCVGLNIGSCRTIQESTATQPDGDGNPWPVVALLTALLCPFVCAAALSFYGREVAQ
jgi:uncharacterized protein YceK